MKILTWFSCHSGAKGPRLLREAAVGNFPQYIFPWSNVSFYGTLGTPCFYCSPIALSVIISSSAFCLLPDMYRSFLMVFLSGVAEYTSPVRLLFIFSGPFIDWWANGARDAENVKAKASLGCCFTCPIRLARPSFGMSCSLASPCWNSWLIVT